MQPLILHLHAFCVHLHFHHAALTFHLPLLVMCVLIACYYYDSIKHQRLRVTLCVIEPLAAVT